MKEILIYSSIYSWSVSDIIKQMEEAKDQGVVLRINTPGGEVYSAYGIIAKFIELESEKSIKVDGHADSAGAFLCCYADNVECLDVSTFLFHRAAFPSYIEGNTEYFTEAMRNSLIKMNKDLRAAMEGKFTADQWKQVTGTTLDDLFALDKRIDVEITAQQAKKLGLVKRLITITPEKRAEIEALAFGMAARSLPNIPTTSSQKEQIQNSKTNYKMTVDQLKAEHPEVYASVVEIGVTQERDRTGSLLAFVEIDQKAVLKAIAEGEPMTQTMMAELTLKAVYKRAGDNMEADSPAAVTPAETKKEKEKTPEAQNVAAFEAEVRKELGLK